MDHYVSDSQMALDPEMVVNKEHLQRHSYPNTIHGAEVWCLINKLGAILSQRIYMNEPNFGDHTYLLKQSALVKICYLR